MLEKWGVLDDKNFALLQKKEKTAIQNWVQKKEQVYAFVLVYLVYDITISKAERPIGSIAIKKAAQNRAKNWLQALKDKSPVAKTAQHSKTKEGMKRPFFTQRSKDSWSIAICPAKTIESKKIAWSGATFSYMRRTQSLGNEDIFFDLINCCPDFFKSKCKIISQISIFTHKLYEFIIKVLHALYKQLKIPVWTNQTIIDFSC